MKSITEKPSTVEFTVVPQMTNQFGSLSYGAMTTLMTEAGNRAIKMRKRGESVPESISLYFIKHVQLGQCSHCGTSDFANEQTICKSGF